MENFAYLLTIDGINPRERAEKLKSSENWEKLYNFASNTERKDLIGEALVEKTRADEEAKPFKDLDKAHMLYSTYSFLEKGLSTQQEKDLLILIFLADLNKNGIKLNELKAKFFPNKE